MFVAKTPELAASTVSAASGAVSGIAVFMEVLPQNTLVHLIAGALGALIALSILTPATFIEALFRLISGVFCAIIFTNSIVEKLSWLPESDKNLAAGFVVGFSAWFVLGMLAKTLDRYRGMNAVDAINEVRGKKS